jgi:threonine dehydratase
MSSDPINKELTTEGIEQAHRLICQVLTPTPLVYSHTLSDMCSCQTFFKLENLQMTGSFKERGAVNKLESLTPEERSRGIIAASAGNHAQAVAYHARRMGIPAKIVMPRHSPLVKVRSTEHWGAVVVLEGETFNDAYLHSKTIIKEENQVYLHPFDDFKVIEGQGSLAVDLLQDPRVQDMDAILVPVGGGGLISGIATYIKAVKPDIQIIGVEESTCDAMHQSLQSGKVVEVAPAPIIADGIAVQKVAARNLATVNRLVDDIVCVTSEEIANAIMLMLEIEKLVIEGSAAVTLAALLNNRVPQLIGKKVVSVISGGNIDVNLLSKIINRGLTFDGRIAKLDSIITDRPGELEHMLGTFREAGANVLEVHHHRFSASAPIGQIGVSITLETRDQKHIDEIVSLLEKRGYLITPERQGADTIK